MFEYKCCSHPGCCKNCISTVDDDGNFIESSDFCLEHTPNKEDVERRMFEYIMSHEKIIGANCQYLTLKDIDISKKIFIGCNFQHTVFNNVIGSNLILIMCIADFSTFINCNFPECKTFSTSIAGSKLEHVNFAGGELVNNNFNGITAYQSCFDNCDLLNSRFIKAILMNTSFVNCNLKEAVFYNIEKSNVSFKYSNENQARFIREVQGVL